MKPFHPRFLYFSSRSPHVQKHLPINIIMSSTPSLLLSLGAAANFPSSYILTASTPFNYERAKIVTISLCFLSYFLPYLLSSTNTTFKPCEICFIFSLGNHTQNTFFLLNPRPSLTNGILHFTTSPYRRHSTRPLRPPHFPVRCHPSQNMRINVNFSERNLFRVIYNSFS